MYTKISLGGFAPKSSFCLHIINEAVLPAQEF